MLVDRAQEVMRVLERLSVEHLGWLMRVHSALLFPAHPPAPSVPVGAERALSQLSAILGDQAPVIEQMSELCAAMRASADEVMRRARTEGRVDPEAYRAFMDAVDAYVREARRIESLFHRQMAETDPLTGVHNRRGMIREIRREWTRAQRTGRPVCVAIADLDFFKRVNDCHGHAVGDKVLCMAADFFVRRLRPYDWVFRYGGEEFLFCLPDTDAETACAALDRLRELMARLPVVLDDGTRLSVTCSIGVAEMVPGRSVHEAITAADEALYVAKRLGRNCVVMAPSPATAANFGPELAAHRLHGLRGVVRH